MDTKHVVCFGCENDLYTKMVLFFLEKYQIFPTLLAVKASKRQSLLIRLHHKFHTGRYKALSIIHPYTWKLIMLERCFARSGFRKEILQPFADYQPRCTTYAVPDINHAKAFDYLKQHNFRIGVLAGVGIVDELIISAIKGPCLNAHPAPLPACRGGGAVENTLCQNKEPCSTVHLVTKGIDAGKIIDNKPLVFTVEDTFESLSLKLSILTASHLAEVTSRLCTSEEPFEYKENKGKLYYWRDFDRKKQILARKNLRKMQKNMRQR